MNPREALVSISLALLVSGCARPQPHPDFEPHAMPRKPVAMPTDCAEGMTLIHGGTLSREAGDAIEIASFCMSRTEVTVDAYRACVAKESCTLARSEITSEDLDGAALAFLSRFCNADREEKRDHPVNCVTYAQASAYCAASKGRLPTADEWAWAARGGDEARRYPWGDARPSATKLNACGVECQEAFEDGGRAHEVMFEESDGFVGTSPVGSFPEGASRDGLLDLGGNVFEWTSSTRRENTHEARGGAWNSAAPEHIETDAPVDVPSDARDGSVGFRCASKPLR